MYTKKGQLLDPHLILECLVPVLIPQLFNIQRVDVSRKPKCLGFATPMEDLDGVIGF